MSERPWDEHLAWCKQRALEYLDEGDVVNAVASMMSDLKTHPEGRVNPYIEMLGIMAARDGDVAGAHRWIVGFR